jgi:hypothetical protein
MVHEIVIVSLEDNFSEVKCMPRPIFRMGRFVFQSLPIAKVSTLSVFRRRNNFKVKWSRFRRVFGHTSMSWDTRITVNAA